MRKRPLFWKQAKTVVSVKAPDAREVFLAGSFNGWNERSHPMQRSPDGEWTIALDGLAPGRYEYKFVIDGQWCCEPGCDMPSEACPDCVPNPFGTMNRVLEVADHRGGAGALSSARPKCAGELSRGVLP